MFDSYLVPPARIAISANTSEMGVTDCFFQCAFCHAILLMEQSVADPVCIAISLLQLFRDYMFPLNFNPHVENEFCLAPVAGLNF